MPELPEIETIRRDLDPKLCNQLLVPKFLADSRIFRFGKKQNLSQDIRVLHLKRIGKYLKICGEDISLCFHMGMSGQLYYTGKLPEDENHVHYIAEVRKSKQDPILGFLIYRDPRRFGFIFDFHNSEENSHERFTRLGPDGLQFHCTHLQALAPHYKYSAKSFLMDQSVIAGVGNIYACEALFAAGIPPQTLAKDINDHGWYVLSSELSIILDLAIKNRGSSVSDYITGDGSKGNAQTLHKVYRRNKKPCFTCGTEITTGVFDDGRTTYYCPKCQNTNCFTIASVQV